MGTQNEWYWRVQMNPLSDLNAIILNNKIPNALLFTGHCGHEKKIAAITFAKTINCLNRKPASELNNANLEAQSEECVPCNRCRSCMKIDASMHPDIIIVASESEKSIIKIGQIREMSSAVASKPHEAKMRMVIIDDAHTMNQEAANAILKILEEPPERTFFVLIARELNALLPTVISRCRHLRFPPLSKQDIAQRLVERWSISPSVAMIAAKSSDGDMDRAMIFANVQLKEDFNYIAKKASIKDGKTDWIARRNWLLNQMSMLLNHDQQSSVKLFYALVISEKLSKEPLLIHDSIAIIKLFLRDMALIRYSKEHSYLINYDSLVNSDCINKMSNFTSRLTCSYLLMALESLHKAESKLQTNASVRLTMEQFFLSLILPTKKVS